MAIRLKRGAVTRSPSPPSPSLAVMSHWSVPKEWTGDTAFIIAGGPSVRDEDLSTLAGKRVIVVNSSWEAFPKADYLFFADLRWWAVQMPRVIPNFNGKIVTTSHGAKHKRLLKLQKVKPPPGLSDDPTKVAVRYTSTQGAINLAVHLGVARIVLIGVDMGAAEDGATHHHTPHQWPQRKGCWDQQMGDLIHCVPLLKEKGIDVINTSMRSRVDWWDKMPLREFLRG